MKKQELKEEGQYSYMKEKEGEDQKIEKKKNKRWIRNKGTGYGGERERGTGVEEEGTIHEGRGRGGSEDEK